MLTMLSSMRSMSFMRAGAPAAQGGVTLIEVLVTVLILAFGLMGLIGMQAKVQAGQSENYQRAQAVLLVQDMSNRLSAGRLSAGAYVTVTPLGTGDAQPASCAATTGAARDQCEWSHAIQGAAEQAGSNSVGAMLAARGCIEQIGVGPAVYRVTVTWQGMSDLSAPALTCGHGLYTRETLRRAISGVVTVPDLTLL
jgi:type IV pilus assembly protein PilV